VKNVEALARYITHDKVLWAQVNGRFEVGQLRCWCQHATIQRLVHNRRVISQAPTARRERNGLKAGPLRALPYFELPIAVRSR
jgi:hypothetical protein